MFPIFTSATKDIRILARNLHRIIFEDRRHGYRSVNAGVAGLQEASQTLARARVYAEAAPTRRRLLPIGLEDDTVIASIIKVAQGLGVRPKEVWTVASSGTLTRGLQIAFPSAKFFAVQTGHSLTEQTAGRAEVLVSLYKYDKPVRAEEAPPYPSEPFYDAKLWTFAVEKGRKGALIWNVAGNRARMAKTN